MQRIIRPLARKPRRLPQFRRKVYMPFGILILGGNAETLRAGMGDRLTQIVVYPYYFLTWKAHMTTNQILATALLTAFCTTVASANPNDIDEMQRVKVIKGMTSYTTAHGTEEIFTYDFDLVGRALISRGNGICDYQKNTLTGHKDIEMTKGDGSKVAVKIPLIDKFAETGRCDGLQKKYFSPRRAQ